MEATEEMLVSKKDGAEEPSIDTDKLSYEIFSILESKFLFGYDDHQLCVPKSAAAAASVGSDGAAAIKTQRGKVCILSIDGGGGVGMRGILPGKALAYLEKALQSKSSDPDARISDYFDLAAGTGVGGFFTAMLFATRDGSRPAFRAEDTWRFLADKGRRFYRKASSASSSPALFPCIFQGGCGRGIAEMTKAMEMAMKETFGESLTLRDTVKPVLIPCYDLRSSAPLVFSRADALENESYDFRLWEVCRATWAEPGRVEPVEMRSIDRSTVCIGVDGGLAMSNPTAAAITHVLHNKQEFPFVRGVEDLMVLSLGCGAAAAPEAAGSRLDYHKLRQWGAKEWARPIARIASDGAADLVDHAVSLAFGQCRIANYMRIQANGSSTGRCGPDVDSDPSSANVKVLLSVAEDMLKQNNVESVLFGGRRISEQSNMEKLDWIAGELVLEHQRRSCRIAPTVAFKQASPKFKTQNFPKESRPHSPRCFQP